MLIRAAFIDDDRTDARVTYRSWFHSIELRRGEHRYDNEMFSPIDFRFSLIFAAFQTKLCHC